MQRQASGVSVLALLAFVCAAFGAGRAGLLTAGRVAERYDGDTVTVEADGERHRCRLLGIDAPELSHARLWTEMDRVSKHATFDARRELHEARNVFRKWAAVMEGHAAKARDALSGLVGGKEILLEYDGQLPPQDRYGRLLVYISAGDMDVNAEMLRLDLAVAETRFPCDRIDECVKIWRAAQASRAGMWAKPQDESAVHPPKIPQPPRQKRIRWSCWAAGTPTGTTAFLQMGEEHRREEQGGVPFRARGPISGVQGLPDMHALR